MQGNTEMIVRGVKFFAWLLSFVVASSCLSTVRAESWRPVLGDADEFYDAAEDLHDRAQKYSDPHSLQVFCALEQTSKNLYDHLRRNACAAEVLSLLNTSGQLLNQSTALVHSNCELRQDRKALSELDKAHAYYAKTAEHIQCVLRPRSHVHVQVAPSTGSYYGPYGSNYNAPAQPWNGNALPQVQPAYPQDPGWLQSSPYTNPPQYPTRYNQHQEQESFGKTLARVLISEVLSR